MVLLSYTGSSQHSTYRPKVFIVILPLNKQKGSISSFHSTCVVLPCPGAVLIFRKQRVTSLELRELVAQQRMHRFRLPIRTPRLLKLVGKWN